MNSIEKLQTILIRIFIHPFKKQRAISFQEQFQQAKRILILLPDAPVVQTLQSDLESVVHALNDKEITLISSGGLLKPKLKYPVNWVNLNLKRQNMWSFRQSDELQRVYSESFDIFIDLHHSINLLGTFLSRKLVAPVQVCMTPSQGTGSFNLIYNQTEPAPYSDRLKGFLTFLLKLLR